MGSKLQTQYLRIKGMTCSSCQRKIEKTLRATAGVKTATVNYNTGTATITYNPNKASQKTLVARIEKIGYHVLKDTESEAPSASKSIGILVIIVALYFLFEQFGILNFLAPRQLAEENMGYSALFVLGLLTSIHCVAMCGGINLSQCLPSDNKSQRQTRFSTFRPALLYNSGRVISYTAVGFVVGGLGSVVSFSSAMQGSVKLIAGIFMIIVGINMLGIFPQLRRFTPRLPKALTNKANAKAQKSGSPLIVGLLNGFMPCGPLLAMQIYALSTGSPLTGALSMFLFSLGTVPLMFGFGAVSSALGKKFTHKALAVGAVFLVVLGLSMFSQGWSLSGLSNSLVLSPDTAKTEAVDSITENGVQIVSSTLSSRSYPNITVTVGTPVTWTIDAPDGSINGCNNSMSISEYGIKHDFKLGANVIEFNPTTTGAFQYSCWMGMIRGTITVVDDISEPQSSTQAVSGQEVASSLITADYSGKGI